LFSWVSRPISIKKKRFKVFKDYHTIDEFFDPKVIKKFGGLIKKKLGEKGALCTNRIFAKKQKQCKF
jgi:hypothetical protein